MNSDYLKNEGNVLRIQKHQLDNSENKLSEIDSLLLYIQNKQENHDVQLDNMVANMENLLQKHQIEIPDDMLNENIVSIENELNSTTSKENQKIVQDLDKVDFTSDMSWEEYMNSVEEYGFKHNLDLKEDPFKLLMTKSQQVEFQKKIKDEFTLKNAQCDKYDYMIAGTCGVISGLVDILFVGSPNDSKLGNVVDDKANQITEKFAEFLGWNKEKAVEKVRNTTASAIGFLEQKFKVNYDQATTYSTDGVVQNLSMSNHHLKNLGHSPDIIGLFFSILNQFTSTSSFVNNGKIITIDAETFELKGDNLVAKIFCGFANWFGHIMSDWTGSSGTVGQGGRGTGVPIPFYNLFQLINIGRFGEKDQETFAVISSKVFEQGYDARHGLAMAIPVVINELLIRFMYTMKVHFYLQKEWKDSLLKENIPELRRMLLVGHGTLCIIDGADACIRSGSGADIIVFLSRTNLLAWTRFGHLALKEVYAWYNSGHIDADAVNEYIDNDLKKMLKK